MTIPASFRSRPFFGRKLIAPALLVLGLCMAEPAWAGPVDVQFLPPDLPGQKICVARDGDSRIIETWTKWDGRTVPKTAPDVILRDGRRLRDLDANKYFDTIENMLAMAESMPAQENKQDVVLDRINLYLSAGKTQQLRDLKLVDKLAGSVASLSPKALNVLSGLYTEGAVVKKDEKQATSLMVRAALGGNADALLHLAKMNIDGKAVEGWNMDPTLAVTMAFGALVGKLDPEICERIGRIAREYGRGDTVRQDDTISERWYRLAADLGDPAAAWKVAGMHLSSELITKDNAVLLKYLTLSADEGNSAAQAELGKAYEAGAIVLRDTAKADYYLGLSADRNSRNGLIRLAAFLEPDLSDPDIRARYVDVLRKLIALPDAPGSAFARLADIVLADRGRWAGEAEARDLLEKGFKLGDPDAAQGLAAILLAHVEQPGVFQRATELLNFAVVNASKSDSMPDLRNAYLCRAPDHPNLRLADFWQASADSAGNETALMQQSDVEALIASNNLEKLATLQTHALYGRPSAVAAYRGYLQQTGSDPKVLEFWDGRIRADVAAMATVYRRELKTDTTMDELQRTIDGLKSAEAGGAWRTSLDLSSVLAERFPGDAAKTTEGLAYLRKAAAIGSGVALTRLLALGEASGTTRQDIFNEYSTIIDERGDADALIFAASVVGDAAKKRDFLRRAVSVIGCDFDNAYKLAEAWAEAGDVAETMHWLEVSQHLAEDKGSRIGVIANRYAALPGDAYQQVALKLYEQGAGLGDGPSLDHLLKLYGDPSSTAYSPTTAVRLFKDVMPKAKAPDLVAIIDKLNQAPAVIRTSVLQSVSIPELYRHLAEGGDVVAMVALAKYVQDNAASAADGKVAADWLKKAADLGDSKAMVALAKAFAMGVGVKPSAETAKALLVQAAAKGSNEARKLLANMS